MALIKFSRGSANDIPPTLTDGQVYFDKDNGQLFLDSETSGGGVKAF